MATLNFNKILLFFLIFGISVAIEIALNKRSCSESTYIFLMKVQAT